MVSRSKNYILAKGEVGQTKPPTRDLPAQDHAYGKAMPKDKFGAKDVLTSWNMGVRTEKKEKELDYRKLNKMALQQRVSSARALQRFRKDNEVLRVPRYDQKLTGKEVFCEAEGANYGRKNRPPTPIKDVVNNEFGTAASQALAEHQEFLAKVSPPPQANAKCSNAKPSRPSAPNPPAPPNSTNSTAPA